MPRFQRFRDYRQNAATPATIATNDTNIPMIDMDDVEIPETFATNRRGALHRITDQIIDICQQTNTDFCVGVGFFNALDWQQLLDGTLVKDELTQCIEFARQKQLGEEFLVRPMPTTQQEVVEQEVLRQHKAIQNLIEQAWAETLLIPFYTVSTNPEFIEYSQEMAKELDISVQKAASALHRISKTIYQAANKAAQQLDKST